jgi:hypothetical protein
MIKYITPLIEAIRTELQPLAAIDDGAKGLDTFNEKVAQCMLDCPFVIRIAQGKKRKLNNDQFSLITGGFTFLSVPFNGVGDELFTLDPIYKLYATFDKSVDRQTKEWKHPSEKELIEISNATYNPRIFMGSAQEEEMRMRMRM